MPIRLHKGEETIYVIFAQIRALENRVCAAVSQLVRRDEAPDLPRFHGPLADAVKELLDALGLVGLTMRVEERRRFFWSRVSLSKAPVKRRLVIVLNALQRRPAGQGRPRVDRVLPTFAPLDMEWAVLRLQRSCMRQSGSNELEPLKCERISYILQRNSRDF